MEHFPSHTHFDGKNKKIYFNTIHHLSISINDNKGYLQTKLEQFFILNFLGCPSTFFDERKIVLTSFFIFF